VAEERFKITVPPFDRPPGHLKLQQKVEKRLVSLINESPLKGEYKAMVQKHPSDTPILLHSHEVLDWLREKRPEIHAFLKQVCLELGLPEESVPILKLHYFLHDSGLASSGIAPYNLAVRVDMVDGPYIHGEGPWLPPGILTHDLDFVVQGNLETFRADSWRALGQHMGKWKAEVEAGRLYETRPGRPTGTIDESTDEMAVEMFQTHQRLKDRDRSQGTIRKRRKDKSRWASIYDEVGFDYESRHGLTPERIPRDTVKRLVQRGRRIMQESRS